MQLVVTVTPQSDFIKGDWSENKRKGMKDAKHFHYEVTLYGFVFL